MFSVVLLLNRMLFIQIEDFKEIFFIIVLCVLQIEEEKKRAARTDYWLQPVRIQLECRKS